MKLTDWFSETEAPSTKGVYQVKADSEIFFSYWDGRRFCHRTMTVDRANEHRTCSLYGDYAVWRGLAEDPNGSKP